ncbi:MAG: hypothetical protein MRY78_06515 [Saprospiraceae bacterium]|nr:hypothetical protein [Saprospiraceae bacterium]
MRFNQYDTLVEAESALRRKGFKMSFELKDGKMRCTKNDAIYTPDEMRIIEYHRFEGMTNPADMSILFAVICNDGSKGTIVSNYGPHSNMNLISFMDKVKILNKETNSVSGAR